MHEISADLALCVCVWWRPGPKRHCCMLCHGLLPRLSPIRRESEQQQHMAYEMYPDSASFRNPSEKVVLRLIKASNAVFGVLSLSLHFPSLLSSPG